MTANPLNVPGLNDTTTSNAEYRQLDGDMHGQMPGMKGVLIPSAVPGKSGQSQAFDPNKAIPVHVDPEYADGFVFDPTKIRETDVARAMAQTADPVDAMRKLSADAEYRNASSAEPDPVPPAAIPTPFSEDPVTLDKPMSAHMPEIDYDKLAAAMVKVPQPSPAPPAVPVHSDPPTPLRPPTQPDPSATQHTPEEKDPRDPLSRDLNIPFVTGLSANRPEFEVFFDLGPLGQAVGRYHGVVETDKVIVLFYDTRFENGFQYLPPSGQKKPMRMECPKIGKTFHAVNAGLMYSLGCIDHLVLIKVETEAEETPVVMG